MKLKYLVAVLALCASSIWIAVVSWPNEKLLLVFCDVGQGDAIFIQKGSNQILIDGGPNRQVLDCLGRNMPFWDRKIEIVALTHPQLDHLGGLNYVLERYGVSYFLSGPEGNQSASFIELKSKIEALQIPVINPYSGQKFNFFGVELDSIWPERSWLETNLVGNCPGGDCQAVKQESILGLSTEKDLNIFSLVFLLKYGGLEVLLMGDADASIQDEILLSNREFGQVEILKIPHHGAKNSLSADFLLKTSPKIAVISVGRNSYGHPSGDLIERLTKVGASIRRTDLEGEIKFEY